MPESAGTSADRALPAVTCWSGNLCVVQLRCAERGDLFVSYSSLLARSAEPRGSGWPGVGSVALSAGGFVSQPGPVACLPGACFGAFPALARVSAHARTLV